MEDDPAAAARMEQIDSPYTPVEERRRRRAERGEGNTIPTSATHPAVAGVGTMGGAGSMDPMGGSGSAAPRTPGGGRDLSNLKLAQNQTELSRQIEDLADTVDAQGKLLVRLLERLDGGGLSTGVGPGSASARGNGYPGQAPAYGGGGAAYIRGADPGSGGGVRRRGSMDKGRDGE